MAPASVPAAAKMPSNTASFSVLISSALNQINLQPDAALFLRIAPRGGQDTRLTAVFALRVTGQFYPFSQRRFDHGRGLLLGDHRLTGLTRLDPGLLRID